MLWETDPTGFVAVEVDGALVGGGAIVSHDGRFGFMGLFIVAPSHRGRGLGRRLSVQRCDALFAPVLRPRALHARRARPADGGRRVAGLEVAWTKDVAATTRYGSFASTPTIADGTAYLQDLGSNVTAVDLASGAVTCEFDRLAAVRRA